MKKFTTMAELLKFAKGKAKHCDTHTELVHDRIHDIAKSGNKDLHRFKVWVQCQLDNMEDIPPCDRKIYDQYLSRID